MYIPVAAAHVFDLSRRARPVAVASDRRARGLWSMLAEALRRDGARPSDAVAEAAEVRTMAWRVRDSQPGFASDLLAAADRHERQFGADR